MEYLKLFEEYCGGGSMCEPKEPFFNWNKRKYRKKKERDIRVEEEKEKFVSNQKDNLEKSFGISHEELMEIIKDIKLDHINYGELGYNVDESRDSLPILELFYGYTIKKFGDDFFMIYDDKGKKKIKASNIRSALKYCNDSYLKYKQEVQDEITAFDEEID